MTSSSSSRRLVRAAMVGMVGLALGAACSGESNGTGPSTNDGGPDIGVKLSFVPPSVSFGEVLIGSTSDAITVTIKNTGMDASQVPTISLSDTKVFKIGTNGCTSIIAS